MPADRCHRTMPPSAPGVPGTGPRSPEELVAALRAGGPALVALSGGVDSAVVAFLARAALGDRAVAVTLTGPAVGSREVAEARAAAQTIGIAHVVLGVDPLADAAYRANPPDRCFFCRRTESRTFTAWGAPRGVRQYLDGIHLDDLGETRPGIQAMDAAGFAHPLVTAGWRKHDVRAYARAQGLPNWDRPSDACLASRIRTGQPITAGLLDQVRRAEEGLVARGFRRVRVRAEGDGARVEVDGSEVPRLLAEPLASTVRGELRALGFATVRLDPVGYRPRPGA